MPLERDFDTSFVAPLASAEKQIQQNYRPVIGVHKWFARRPGTLFRALLLAEFGGGTPLSENFYKNHSLDNLVIADPFMGGGTPLIEANRLGCKVVGFDINPMAYWIVNQELASLDLDIFQQIAREVISEVETQLAPLYHTSCSICGNSQAIVKYFLWVKQQNCSDCGSTLDLFSGYLIATNQRHPNHVLLCPECGDLNESPQKPDSGSRISCRHCSAELSIQGPARRNKINCPECQKENKYPNPKFMSSPPKHRLFAIEYHCGKCRSGHKGRFFKPPDEDDLNRFERARSHLGSQSSSPHIPEAPIPPGDETDRLHRWGYRLFKDLFNERQLGGLSVLMKRISQIEDKSARFALATIFSDTLRYQNMLCRYDTWALKCQDIFSVHGFPVGLIQCENNLLGIPGIGSGGFRHFVEKFDRAKQYCQKPFEIRKTNGRKQFIHISGERIEARIVDQVSSLESHKRAAFIASKSGSTEKLPPNFLDGVFTDPPYFSNVQYAELMDFCYVWLRLLLKDEIPAFTPDYSRSDEEVTGNVTMGRGLAEFTQGLVDVFSNMTRALKPQAPFVFTYHHNALEAYFPLVIAILDSGLYCTATLHCPAEMSASLHINGTSSSKIDTIFICRQERDSPQPISHTFPQIVSEIERDFLDLHRGDVTISPGDISCIILGHSTRHIINGFASCWSKREKMPDKIEKVKQAFNQFLADTPVSSIADQVTQELQKKLSRLPDSTKNDTRQLDLPGIRG